MSCTLQAIFEKELMISDCAVLLLFTGRKEEKICVKIAPYPTTAIKQQAISGIAMLQKGSHRSPGRTTRPGLSTAGCGP
jgi:hypothetical protein